MTLLSDGVELAQTLAALEASDKGHDFVEPPHLFIGLCSVGKMLSSDLQAPPNFTDDLMAGVRREWDELSEVFSQAGAHPTPLRRAIRHRLGANKVTTAERRPGPSESSKSVLSRASELAQQRAAPAVSLTDLLIAVLDNGSEPVMATLRDQSVDVTALRAAARNLVKSDEPPAQTRVEIRQTLDAREAVAAVAAAATPDSARRLTLLCDLALLFGREAKLESLLQTILERLLDVLPKAARGALVVREPATEDLVLKAHVPLGNPSLSITLARQAMEHREAFIWPPGISAPGADVQTLTMSSYHITSAMYAPLVWEGEPLGVVCVDNSEGASAFENDDLQLLRAVSHHAAMAVAHRRVQDELREHVELARRLLSSRFPPQLREKLIRQAASGTLPLGTRQSPITVLTSDIRGFTRLTERLGPLWMSELLNEYFPLLIEGIFAHEGTVERFVGDAIFAVFGSPEEDEFQHEHALRAAVGMQNAVKILSARRRARGAPTCDIGIGIDCGTTLHGFIGNAERMEFAVIGDAANRASRHCSAAAGGEILISQEMYGHVFRIIEALPVSISTKHEGELAAYRVVGLKEVKKI